MSKIDCFGVFERFMHQNSKTQAYISIF
ncbi:hypothetical protein E2C01_034731 [Portunus trituberculatus]|uniref:Uncharacterized protein n=1 Tax=Portunus trituberculatus TaxID=210409 RepID=A0A5B7F6G5_PORTR|nr:hypothetical protein [Portunus trituberculatus]